MIDLQPLMDRLAAELAAPDDREPVRAVIARNEARLAEIQRGIRLAGEHIDRLRAQIDRLSPGSPQAAPKDPTL